MDQITPLKLINDNAEVYWINSLNSFDLAMEYLTDQGTCVPTLLAIDTEFERTSTYHPIGALLQITDGKRVFLVDLTQVSVIDGVPQAFKALLSNPDCLKLMHAAREDLELIEHLWGVSINPLFDTQWAAGFIYEDTQMGLGQLVAELCHVQLDKAHTRSNWLHRPLSDHQLAYAVMDVWYLIQAYEPLATQLRQANLYESVLQDCTWIYQIEQSIYDQWRFLHETWSLGAQARQQLFALLSWRQDFLLSANLPKKWAPSDQDLLGLVTGSFKQLEEVAVYLKQANPRHFKHIKNQLKLIYQVISNQASAMYEARELNKSSGNDVQVQPLAPLYPDAKSLLKALRQVVKQKADAMNWPEARLCRKKWLINWLRLFLDSQLKAEEFDQSCLGPVWQGWRGNLLHQEFMDAVQAIPKEVNLILDQLKARSGCEVVMNQGQRKVGSC